MTQKRLGKWTFRVAMMIGSFTVHTMGSASDAIIAKEWKGEIFRPKEGAFYFKQRLTGFRNPGKILGPVTVTLFNIIEQRSVVIVNAPSPVDSYPREIWRVPAGKYRIDRLQLADDSGVTRKWLNTGPQSAPLIIVPKVGLANLGVWTLSPDGTSGLGAKFEMAANSYTETSPKTDSSVSAVVNGFTGAIQEVFGGKRVLDGAPSGGGDANTLRAAVSFTRQIAMFYKLDLFKHNRFNKDVMGAVGAFDQNLRGCYTKALSTNANLRGSILFKILISQNTGTMRQVHKGGGTLLDGSVSDCLVLELMQIPLPVRENMIGELTFTFDVK